MRWGDVIDAVCTELEGDTALVTAMGGSVDVGPSRNGERVVTPSIRYFFFSDHEEEVWNPMVAQFDIFASSVATGAAIESRMRALLHRDVQATIGGMSMISQLDDARTAAETEPGLYHRQLDFRFEAIRSKYVTS